MSDKEQSEPFVFFVLGFRLQPLKALACLAEEGRRHELRRKVREAGAVAQHFCWRRNMDDSGLVKVVRRARRHSLWLCASRLGLFASPDQGLRIAR